MRTLLFLVAVFAIGCGATQGRLPLDAATDGPQPITRTLTAYAPMLDVLPSSSTAVSVLLADAAGQAVSGATVSFSLHGDVDDATLSAATATTMTTDSPGVARITFVASSASATMILRASSSGAADVDIHISVSATGFGAVQVTAQYAGMRSPTAMELDLFEGVTCSAIGMLEPVRSVPLPASGGVATFGDLPAGNSFAIRGRALSTGATVLASGCSDGLVVTAGGTVLASVQFIDAPLQASGPYAIGLSLDLGPIPAQAAVQWAAAVATLAATQGDEAGYVLAAIGSAVESASASDYAAFEAALPGLRASLAMDLATRSAGPVEVLTQFAAQTASVVQTVSAAIAVTAPTMPTAASTPLTVTAITVTFDPLTPDVHIDDVSRSIAPAGTGTIAISADDRAAGALVGLALPFPTIARGGADALLVRLGAPSASEWTEVNTDCVHVASLLISATGACNATCITDACNTAVDALAAALDGAISSVDAMHATASMQFEGSARAVAGSLILQSVAVSPLVGNFDDSATALLLGTAALQIP